MTEQLNWTDDDVKKEVHPQNKVCHCFPTYLHEVMGPEAMILVFWMLSFKPAFFMLLFHFHQEAL